MMQIPAVEDRRSFDGTCWDGVSEDTLVQALAAPALVCVEAGLLIEGGSGCDDPFDLSARDCKGIRDGD